MTDTITLTGVVATQPRTLQTETGLAICSFRLASGQRRFDRQSNTWVDGDTNWYTVTTFRTLADNVAASVTKGDRVALTGRLRVRFWESGERSGTTVEVDADSVGHDLRWGRTRYTRTTTQRKAESDSDNDSNSSRSDSPVGSPDSVDTVAASELSDAAAPAHEPTDHGPRMHVEVPIPADPSGDEGADPHEWAPVQAEQPF